MTIDMTALTEEQKQSSECKEMCAGMTRQLNGPGFISQLCAHEAAHVIFYQMMGEIRWRPLPPRIVSAAGRLNGQLAAIEFLEKPTCYPQTWQNWVNNLAKGSVAGSVVARRFGATRFTGEEGDRICFENECAQLIAHFGVTINTDRVWEVARASVERDLESNPAIMESIFNLAIELRTLFCL